MMNYEEVFSLEHLMVCAKECCEGVRWKCSTQLFELSMSRWVANLHRQLMNGEYKTKGFVDFYIMERGKRRHIQAVHISERCVQKCLCKYYLKPLIEPRLIYDNAASLKGKGTGFSIKRFRKHLVSHYKKHGKQGGILLVDYHDYFNSINHEILLNMLRCMVDDDRLYELISLFINAFEGDTGLGLGSEVSQICAVFYPNMVDHYIKEHLHIKGYGRYMDDSYLIHEDKDYLLFCLSKIERLSAELGLTLNYKRTKVYNLTEGFTFLKKRFFITDNGKIIMRLSKDNIKRRKRILKTIKQYNRNPQQSYQSWRSYALKCNSYKTVCGIDKLYSDLYKGEN